MLEAGALIQQRYQIVRLIGRGGMGAVYEAIDQRLRNTVALKQMLGGGLDSADAFEREARLLAALRHPALPRVMDYFHEGGGHFLVMEFFSGADLAALQARRGAPFLPAEVLAWAEQLLDALIYLHRQSPPVIHRDIKPQNLKLTLDGQVVLLDFGLAKGAVAGSSDGQSFFGYTLHYAPLEQIEGSGTEPRSDLYALAATLYQLLSDRQPLSAPMRADAVLMGRADPLVPLEQINPAVPAELAALIGQALALSREARPPDAHAMRAALAAVRNIDATVSNPRPALAAAPPAPPLASRDSSRPASISWETVLAAAQRQSELVLRELRGTPKRLGPYIGETYVRRAELELDLDGFLAATSVGLLLLGEAGSGKTCGLCRWMEDLQEAGHAVFFYRCGGSLGPEIERELARDLGLDQPEGLLAGLDHAATVARAAHRQIVIIFDGLNEFRSGTAGGPELLLKQIDGLVGRLRGAGVRIALSCSSATWGQLERAGATRLNWSAYYQGADGEPSLQAERFSVAELGVAYERYQAFFQLRTPLANLPEPVRERLARPLLLRMLAEGYRGGEVAVAARGLTMSIFRRFYEERVRQRRDLLFIEELAREMLRSGSTSLPVSELARNEALRGELLSEDPDSSYIRLLDGGILSEVAGGPFLGDVATFSYSEVGAYVLASFMLRSSATRDGVTTAVERLMGQVRSFPLAWEIARTLLLLYKSPQVFADLAQSPDVERRELAVQSLTELHADEPAVASEIIKQLCGLDSQEARRSGLKAAYAIGPRAREIFLWAASKGGPALRRAARDALYLIWRRDPEFTYGLLGDLVGRVGIGALRDLRNIVEFFVELSVTIYINHPERPDVRDRTVELYYELAKHRLHLDVINTALLGKSIEDLIFQAVASAFSQPILDTMMLAEIVPIEQFFALSHERRAVLRRVAPLFDPATPLELHLADLELLLREENAFFCLVAVAELATHAHADFARALPTIMQLFERLDGPGRLWILLGFSVLLPHTPPEWAATIELLTERIFAEHPELAYGAQSSLLAALDILLLPLGLAYGKLGQTLPLIELLLQDGLLRGDERQIDRCVAGLGAVGFYFPAAAFRLLGDVVLATEGAALPAAFERTLATIRTLHLDETDIFMRQAGLSDEIQRRVAAVADTELVRRYIYWLGLYNHVVHSSVYYPRIRRNLAMSALHILAEVNTPQEFIAQYTAAVYRLLREAGFRLSEWTLP